MPETLNRYGYCWGNPIIYADRTGLVAYIIYDALNEDNDKENVLEKYAFEVEKVRLEELYGETPIMCPVTSVEDTEEYSFAEVWINQIGYDEEGNAVEIDEVSIIAHGNKKGIYIDGDYIKTDYLEDYPKEIQIITLNSCNAGNIDNESNIARVFLRTQNVEEVVAWDGMQALYIDLYKGCGLHIDQRDFFAQEDKRKINILGFEIELFPRLPMGKLIYKLDENGEEIVENGKGKRIYYECQN